MGSDIPHDIILEILANLPVKSLLRFKCVSKLWFSSIMASGFVDRHLSNQKRSSPRFLLASCAYHECRFTKELLLGSIVLHEQTRVDHSWKLAPDLPELEDCYCMLHCDGVLCFYGCQTLGIHLFNPSTHQFRTLPHGFLVSPIWYFKDPDPRSPRHGDLRRLGFGRDLVTKQYKIVNVFNQYFPHGQLHPDLCEVFTLDSNPRASWKVIGAVPYKIALSEATPVHVNGAIYWFTDPLYYQTTFIVMFDMHKETFKAVPHPSCCPHPRRSMFHMQLGCLRGCLCLAEQEYENQLNMWIMEDLMTWEKIFCINILFLDVITCCLVGSAITELKDGTIVIYGYGNNMYMYDPKSKNLHLVSHGKTGQFQFVPTTFTESLVPLN